MNLLMTANNTDPNCSPETRRQKVALLVICYHLGRYIVACQSLDAPARRRLIRVTEQARTAAEDLSGQRSNGPLAVEGVDDSVAKERAIQIATAYMSGRLSSVIELRGSLTEGILTGVLKPGREHVEDTQILIDEERRAA